MWEGEDEPLPDGNWPLIAPSPLPYLPGVSQEPREMTRADMDAVREQFVASRARGGGGGVRPARAAHGPRLPALVVPVAAHQPPRRRVRRDARGPCPLPARGVRGVPRRLAVGSADVRADLGAPTGPRAGSTATRRWPSPRCCGRRAATSSTSPPGQVWPDQRPAYGRSFQTPFADRIRHEAGIPTIAVGAISSYDDVNTIILSGRADLCALARPHLYDPHWTLHAAAEQGYTGAVWVPQYRSGSRRPQTGKGDGIRRAPVRRFGPSPMRSARPPAGGRGWPHESRRGRHGRHPRHRPRRSCERFEEAGDRVRRPAARHVRRHRRGGGGGGVRATIGPVDVLVNNAGVSSSAPLARTTLDDWRAQMDVNATGAFLCTRAVLPRHARARLRPHRHRRLDRGPRGRALHGGLHRVQARGASASCGPSPRRWRAPASPANAVCPAFVRTDMTDALGRADRRPDRPRPSRGGGGAGGRRRRWAGCSSPRRWPSPCAFLAAAEAGAINGQTLIIDGGGIQT